MIIPETISKEILQLKLDLLTGSCYPAFCLLQLFAFLEPSEIPLQLLRRGCSDKAFWNEHGQPDKLTPQEAGVDQHLLDIILRETRLDDALNQLTSMTLVSRSTSVEGDESVTLNPVIQAYAAERALRDGQHWQEQAILLCCQAFPSTERLGPGRFGTRGRQMLAQIPRILVVMDGIKLGRNPLLRRALITMLLAASKFSTLDFKQEMITRCKSLITNETEQYLKTELVCRESLVLRLCSDTERSSAVILDHMKSLCTSAAQRTDERSRAQQGALVITIANNLLLEDKPAGAITELVAWKPLNERNVSPYEQDIEHQKSTLLVRALRYEERFQDAIEYCESILPSTGHPKEPTQIRPGWQLQLFIQLSDLYCEVGTPSCALKLLQSEIKYVEALNQHQTPRGTDLLLCHAEALLRQGSYEAAQFAFLAILETLQKTPISDMLSQSKNFRALAALARISHLKQDWSDAMARWSVALEFLRKYKWRNTFFEGVVLLSLAQALHHLGEADQALQSISQANICLKTKKPKLFILALATYWYEFVCVPLGKSGADPTVLESPAHHCET
ncbi:hypothetical protein HII31_13014 [Pseudocercospora fuligena]|uniref:Uncharacterized protein n=1 Tax=Pseudocercospora fuligena TaxID=685502 RepID=A0A8H6R6Y1_9PEZI|nr:hypothetical protein HII31_13014 [Pseudocercospora fuligena]